MPARAHTPAPLRLLAEDAEDLKIVSAALQDAVARVGDICYEPAARRLTLIFNRFCWEKAQADGCAERVRSALQFGDVQRVQCRNLRHKAKDALVCLLALEFEPGAPPGGAALLHFSGGGDLRVEVECVDAVLADVSETWPAKRAPCHDVEAAAAPREAGRIAPV